jgi:hypothetical protein
VAKISTDGSCGNLPGYVCDGSAYGDCCSAYGFCGNNVTHCAPTLGCQPEFGACKPLETGSAVPSPTGRCGGSGNFTCLRSGLGDCCSSSGWCGPTDGHCGEGCQPQYGICHGPAKEQALIGKVAPMRGGVSTDATCGTRSGKSCAGSKYGPCCSQTGYCGAKTEYCGQGW